MSNLALAAASIVTAGATLVCPTAAGAHSATPPRPAVARPAFLVLPPERSIDEADELHEPKAPYNATLDEGRIEIFVSLDWSDMHITAESDYDRPTMAGLLDRLETYGIEAMDEDECPAELLDDGRVRVYLAVMA